MQPVKTAIEDERILKQAVLRARRERSKAVRHMVVTLWRMLTAREEKGNAPIPRQASRC